MSKSSARLSMSVREEMVSIRDINRSPTQRATKGKGKKTSDCGFHFGSHNTYIVEAKSKMEFHMNISVNTQENQNTIIYGNKYN